MMRAQSGHHGQIAAAGDDEMSKFANEYGIVLAEPREQFSGSVPKELARINIIGRKYRSQSMCVGSGNVEPVLFPKSRIGGESRDDLCATQGVAYAEAVQHTRQHAGKAQFTTEPGYIEPGAQAVGDYARTR